MDRAGGTQRRRVRVQRDCGYAPVVPPVDVLFVTKRTSAIGRRMASLVASLQTRNRERVIVRFVDAEAEPELLSHLGIRTLPAVVFFHDRRPVACLRGRTTLEELQETLDRCG
jgi:thioredoxin-like negative regulator of GroEL